jgi:hypothetical protein
MSCKKRALRKQSRVNDMPEIDRINFAWLVCAPHGPSPEAASRQTPGFAPANQEETAVSLKYGDYPDERQFQ